MFIYLIIKINTPLNPTTPLQPQHYGIGVLGFWGLLNSEWLLQRDKKFLVFELAYPVT